VEQMTFKVVGFNLLDLIKCDYEQYKNYIIMDAAPATGILHITENSPYFLNGRISLRGKNHGIYPYNYLEMIDSIFGHEPNTIEVCSYSVRGLKTNGDCFTVDINPTTLPDVVDDAQYLRRVVSNQFSRYRCDPPYNDRTAASMYNTSLPDTMKLLRAGARVCKANALLFLLLGPQNYQWCPAGVKRIGLFLISIIPNNELRALNIYYKLPD
jgi:hypothetical protein